MQEVDERLMEVSDLLSEILTDRPNPTSVKRLFMNVSDFKDSVSLSSQEEAQFWKKFADVIKEQLRPSFQ